MKNLTITLLTLLISLGVVAEPMTFLEVEEEGYLIASEDSNEILMVDHSNQKWLRGIIYSGKQVEMRYGSGGCIKEFKGWEFLKQPNDSSLELETKITTHYAKILSKELKDAIKDYKKNNEDFQVNFFDGDYWSCFEFTESLNLNSLFVLAESQPSTFCKLLEDESYWNDIFSDKNISCDKNLNLTKESFVLVEKELNEKILKESEVDNCICNGEYEDYCRLNESEHFLGKCSGPDKRIFGKTFYSSGTIFEGSYHEDNSHHIGLLEWDNGNKIQGEFYISPEDYLFPNEIDPSKHIVVIGQYLLDTITSRGFFVLNDEGFLVLTGYGTKFNTDASLGWTYQAGLYLNDDLSGEALMTYVDEEEEQVFWFDVSQGLDSEVYIQINDVKYINNTNMEKIADGWDAESEAEIERIKEVLKFSNDLLEMNFEILEERKEKLLSDSSKETKIIKPLSSETTASIQELLAALGYETGKIDGILGRLTIAAIKAFQKEQDIEVTGRPTEELLITLQTEVRRSKSSDQSATNAPVKLPVIATGTGFYIQKNILVTNNHVIEECDYISNEDGVNLSLKTADVINDIAILTGPDNLFNLYLSSNPSLGQTIYAGGFPYNNILNNFNFSSGNVSSLFGLGSNVSEFQFTAPVQPGSSGGAILNDKGGVVGITVSVASINLMERTKSIPQNINFGIKVEVLKDILTENKINFKQGNSFWFKSDQEDIAELSKGSSIVINCHAAKRD
tara:strand:+ start:345 stop:2549 length:2205 start_codon:yes stop_codon:yes gene_type:complete